MKIFAFLAVLGSSQALNLGIHLPLINIDIGALPLIDIDVDTKFQDFQKTFNKTYSSVDELTKRLKIFTENLIEFAAHNVLYTLGEVTHKVGINQFSDWTKDEFMDYINKGLRKKPKARRSIRASQPKNSSLPTSVDWRKKDAVTVVKDQGLCGSCYAFSAVAVLESHYAIHKGPLTTLSEQDVIDCSYAEDNDGCDGGLVTNTYDFVKIHGIQSEKNYPYREAEGKCRLNGNNPVTSVNGYVEITPGDENQLQNVLANVGPVSVAIDGTFELQSYESGILDDKFCTTDELNHAVLAVGYGVENGKEYYILKNSWGDYWGEYGFFKMVRNKDNRCGITTLASYPLM